MCESHSDNSWYTRHEFRELTAISRIVWSLDLMTAIDLLPFYGSADYCAQLLLNNKYV